MRKYKQVIMAVLIAAVLVTLSWFAGSSGKKPETVRVLTAAADIMAGTVIEEEHLSFLEIPAAGISDIYCRDMRDAIGMWAETGFRQGEILTRHRLVTETTGLKYPGSAPGRRLMTVRLNAADANGYWLAEGNLIDLYLVPRGMSEYSAAKFSGLKIIRIIGNTTGSDQLICLDLSLEQADFLAERIDSCSIRISVINE